MAQIMRYFRSLALELGEPDARVFIRQSFPLILFVCVVALVFGGVFGYIIW